ncbi:TonB-dependent receptor plug domain-containing protein [Advenella kashmirensis]|uniref:TonB-dependent receptor plug domain-containing protein n=1 Tax=Advenella kashmirensis TaxID=310575 RepID=UPI0019309C2E|nr:TonB-dependent receptor plug domain-containing protein [Advenella kashmirensis]
MHKNILLAITAVCTTTSVKAQEAPQVLAPIVATASRSDIDPENAPQKIVIIDSEQIQQQLAISTNSSNVLSNLLPAYTPSRDKMNGSGETLRGRTPLIMIDGVPQSNPLRPTGREVHTIDYSMVDHIEVINGATASNGIGGTGGVINIVTKSRSRVRSISISAFRPPRLHHN